LTRPDLGITFVGFQNYITLFNSAEFWATMGRTVSWTALSVGGKVLIGFGLALLLTQEIRFKRVYMFCLLIPWVTPMVVAAVAWRWVYDGQFGMLNWVLMELFILSEQYIWLGNQTSAFITTALTDMWLGLPFMVLMFLAGLQSIPIELNESSRMDGASGLQRLYYITLPMMKPIILVATTLSTIWTFNSFGVIWPMTGGGPVNSTTTLIVDGYKKSFGAFDMGMGSAIAIVIFLTLLIFTVLYYRLLTKEEEL
jgi:multiple sugar transport system permease protein